MEEQKENAIIKCVKKFIQDECPYLDDLAKINVDYLNPDSKDYESWSLEPIEVPMILKKNVLGTKTRRQCQFVLATRSFFNVIEDTQNIKNLYLFEKIAEWFYQCTKSRNLPILNEGETSVSIESTSGGYLYGTNAQATLARYQMTCKFIYDKKEEIERR